MIDPVAMARDAAKAGATKFLDEVRRDDDSVVYKDPVSAPLGSNRHEVPFDLDEAEVA
jgi:hypothetical protein